MRPRVLM